MQIFNPETSINSGQVFLWEKNGGSWYGIYADHVVKFTQDRDGKSEFLSYPEIGSCERKIFRLDDDIKGILAEISRDPLLRRLVKMYSGLRVLRQEPQQCIFSFVCASNTNIPMIRRMLYSLTKKFGTPVTVDGKQFFTFPSASRINRAAVDELRACGLGYRAKAIKSVAGGIVDGSLDLDGLARTSYDAARGELLKVYGIGDKIADCVLLFSLEKLEAFPIDVWIARALAGHYRWLCGEHLGDKLTPRQYELLSERIRRHFGRYAGYAQQFLYYHMRQNAGKKW